MPTQAPEGRLFGAAETAKENPNIIRKGLGIPQTSTQASFVDVANNPFWEFADPDFLGSRWDKSYPFQLLLMKKVGGTYETQRTFTLPIPPQEVSFETPFANDVKVTLGGISIEHNGAPLRYINFNGTTGVTPLRGNVITPANRTFVNSVFGGTITAARNTVQQAAALLSGTSLEGPNVIPQAEADGLDFARGTGFYQFLLLERFIEGYASLKQTKGGLDYRLGLAIWKKNEIYLVEPMSFNVRRTGESPLEWPYSMRFVAWRRIANKSPPSSLVNKLDLGGDNVFSQVANALMRARKVVASARNILFAIRNDIDRALLNPLRQTILLLKDTVGLSLTAADFGPQLANDFKGPVLEAFNSGKNSFTQLFSKGSELNSNIVKIQKSLAGLSDESSKANSGAGNASVDRRQEPFRSGDNNKDTAAWPNKIFNNAPDYPDFFDALNIGQLNLRPPTIKKIELERAQAASLTQDDFAGYRNAVASILADFEQSIGEGNDTFDSTFHPPAQIQIKVATADDWEIVYALNDAMAAYDILITETTNFTSSTVNTMDYVAGLASQSGIAFQIPLSKFAVPFPYGFTLEKLSLQYLNTPDRWHEIATLNGLQSPYVDEVGFTLTLSTNGIGRNVTVDDPTNLYVGQPVWLSSDVVRREQRRIQGIKQLSSTYIVVTLDGDADLEQFTTAGNAILQAFLPNTVNSSKLYSFRLIRLWMNLNLN
jgi:hypothetical protein